MKLCSEFRVAPKGIIRVLGFGTVLLNVGLNACVYWGYARYIL